MFSTHDKILTRLFGAERIPAHMGVEPTSKPVGARDFAAWRFAGGKMPEISTIQDQLVLLKQFGYFREDVYAAWPGQAGRGRQNTAGRPHPSGRGDRARR